jgi:hypothetical protein
MQASAAGRSAWLGNESGEAKLEIAVRGPAVTAEPDGAVDGGDFSAFPCWCLDCGVVWRRLQRQRAGVWNYRSAECRLNFHTTVPKRRLVSTHILKGVH